MLSWCIVLFWTYTYSFLGYNYRFSLHITHTYVYITYAFWDCHNALVVVGLYSFLINNLFTKHVYAYSALFKRNHYYKDSLSLFTASSVSQYWQKINFAFSYQQNVCVSIKNLQTFYFIYFWLFYTSFWQNKAHYNIWQSVHQW